MSQERNEEMLELDQMLAQMAQETPEMPADFHARWTEAVRAEAGQKKTEKQQEPVYDPFYALFRSKTAPVSGIDVPAVLEAFLFPYPVPYPGEKPLAFDLFIIVYFYINVVPVIRL